MAVSLFLLCATSVRSVDHTPARARKPATTVKINDVDDLNIRLKDKTKFKRSLIPKSIARLHGKRVRIHGDMSTTFRLHGIKAFLFSGDTKGKRYRMPYLLPPSHIFIAVHLRSGTTTSFSRKPMVVEGRLFIRPWIDEEDGKLYLLYEIREATIRPTKRRLGFRPTLFIGC